MISIVLPAFNEGKRIAGTVKEVKAYAKRNGLNVEVIVVDDGSSDDTAARASAAGAKLISYSDNWGKGVAVRRSLHIKGAQLWVSNSLFVQTCVLHI